MICAYVLIGSCDRFGFRTTTLNRNALYKVVRDSICFDSLFFVAGQEKLRPRLKQSDEKLQTKTTWSFAFSCPSVSLLAFPLLSFWVLIGSLWRLLWIWFHKTQSKLAEWRHYAGADIPPTKRSTSWTDWYWDFKLSISFWVMPAFCRSSKLFTIGVILQNVFRYVVYEGTPRSRPLWMFRDTRSDKSPGPRNKFSCIDLEKSLGKESDQRSTINRMQINIVY